MGANAGTTTSILGFPERIGVEGGRVNSGGVTASGAVVSMGAEPSLSADGSV